LLKPILKAMGQTPPAPTKKTANIRNIESGDAVVAEISKMRKHRNPIVIKPMEGK
jgi:hypothetical protein